MSDIERSNSMFKFKTICQRLGVPIAAEKLFIFNIGTTPQRYQYKVIIHN
jgi:hypothetical protein